MSSQQTEWWPLLLVFAVIVLEAIRGVLLKRARQDAAKSLEEVLKELRALDAAEQGKGEG